MAKQLNRGDKKRRRRGYILGMAFFTALVALSFAIYRNTHLTRTDLKIVIDHLPQEFVGYKIAHLSDIHNASFINDSGSHSLLSILSSAEPDIIVITGDLVDRRTPDIDAALAFINCSLDIAPVLFVSGNHERAPLGGSDITLYDSLESPLLETGAKILDSDTFTVHRGNSSIAFAGIGDPAGDPYFEFKLNRIASIAHELSKTTILLSHRPEYAELYGELGFDLVLTGHAHGGQVILPGIGPVIAPNQGFFPDLTEGVHSIEIYSGLSQLVISRGIGNSLVPLRINNDPELVIITLTQHDPSKSSA